MVRFALPMIVLITGEVAEILHVLILPQGVAIMQLNCRITHQAYITGGTVVALGASGMAMNFGSNSTQGSMLVSCSQMQESGSMVTLKDSEGRLLVSYEAQGSYNSAVISCPEIQVGATYTLTMGDESMEAPDRNDSLLFQ